MAETMIKAETTASILSRLERSGGRIEGCGFRIARYLVPSRTLRYDLGFASVYSGCAIGYPLNAYEGISEALTGTEDRFIGNRSGDLENRRIR
ncbi:MAG: hypothetical protein MAG451_02901 [Anaerolineales bacterium]|nr:hypothetical protein [Anaerolineales bacterium]